MSTWRSFAYITSADFVVRSAYQMGKSPLLPIFAAALGATGAFLGFIVSVSTLTGMVLKPFIGVLSDRWGRRGWLLLGTAFFALMPFIYRFVHTPEQLFMIRIVHGLATAIYGPVTLAYVAELSRSHRAERLGWFGMARNAGYVVGPAAAGWMLLTMSPVTVFTVIGLLSSIAFLPVLLLPESSLPDRRHRLPLGQQAMQSLGSGVRTPAIWLAGGLEATFYIALYAIKTFLPIYALSIDINIAVVGAFLAVQAATHMMLNPLGGRIADKLGYLMTVGAGMAIFGATLPLLAAANNGLILMVPALLIGVAQALILPSTIALVSSRVNQDSIATGLGLVGTLRNAGKVAGPTLAGFLIQRLEYTLTFQLMGVAMLVGAGAVWYWAVFLGAAAEPKREASA